jgi:signal transduction histidine kinase/HPt (histidine-containing phosphotransfer) domain-containing protein
MHAVTSRPHILIIDDVIENVGLLGDTLDDLAEVQFATSGQEGVDLARAAPPHLILLDVMMPDMDGFQVLDQLKRDKRTAQVPVLFVTARTDVETESRALIRGAVDFIQKPIRAEAVRSRVQLHLRLSQQTAELSAANAALEGRIDQRSQELVEALGRAEASTRAKASFLARVSHELRTPLNTVIGLAQVGLRDAAAGLPVETHYARILSAGQELLGVINDVIDFSALEMGGLSVRRQPLNLADTVAQAVQKVEPSAAAKGLSFQVTWALSASLVVLGDARRVEQVLVQLLSNAVKFTQAGHVHLDIRETPEQVVLEVSDTGIGMSPRQLQNLFQPFEQMDGSNTRAYSGLGLGLVIAQHLAQEMGGIIEVASLPGEGTEVRFSLVRASAQEATLPAPQAQKLGRLSGLRLLAVEDIEVNRFLLTRIFQQEGADFHFEDNGRHAIDAVSHTLESGTKAPRFDAVLMDIQMPLMDGYEATRRIRELAPELPVIGLSAHSLPQDRTKSLASGMSAHLAKPVDVDEMVGTVLRACGRAVPEWRTASHGAGAATLPPEAARAEPAPDGAAATPEAEDAALREPPALPAPVDWTGLGNSLAASETFLVQLAKALVRNLQGKPEALRKAAQQRDHATLKYEAHAIKGIAGNVKAQAAYELAERAESASKEMLEEAFVLAQALAQEVERVTASALSRLGS